MSMGLAHRVRGGVLWWPVEGSGCPQLPQWGWSISGTPGSRPACNTTGRRAARCGGTPTWSLDALGPLHAEPDARGPGDRSTVTQAALWSADGPWRRGECTSRGRPDWRSAPPGTVRAVTWHGATETAGAGGRTTSRCARCAGRWRLGGGS